MKLRYLGLVLAFMGTGMLAADLHERQPILPEHVRQPNLRHRLVRSVCTRQNAERVIWIGVGAALVSATWYMSGNCAEMGVACDSARVALEGCTSRLDLLTGQLGQLTNVTTALICEFLPQNCPK